MTRDENGQRVFDCGANMGLSTFFHITIAASSDVVAVGQYNYNRISYQLTISDAVGLDSPIVWSSSNPALATVDQDGTVTSIGIGQVTITAVSSGFVSRTQLIASFMPVSPNLTAVSSERLLLTPASTVTYDVNDISYSRTDPDIFNDQYQLAVLEMPGTLSWTSSMPSVATVNSSGLVTGIASGTTTITVTNGTISESISLPFTRTPLGATVTTGYAAGSMRKSIEDFFAARLGVVTFPPAPHTVEEVVSE